jgi:hypothetical protein
MQVMDDTKAARWCAARSIQAHRQEPTGWLYLAHPGMNHCLIVSIPRNGMRSVALARLLMLDGVLEGEEVNFNGCLLWLRDWEIGSPEFDSVGWKLLESLRAVAGHHSSLREDPAQVFEPGELLSAHAALVLPMVFGWDAYYVPAVGESLVYVSHHERLYVVSRTVASKQRIERSLAAGKWEARESQWPPGPAWSPSTGDS